jgi:hypothetical protein
MLAGIVSGAADRTELIKKVLCNLNLQVLILVQKPPNALLRLFHVAQSIGDHHIHARLNAVIHFPTLQKAGSSPTRRTVGNLADAVLIGIKRPLLALAQRCPVPLARQFTNCGVP